jgi:hypothetical protein
MMRLLIIQSAQKPSNYKTLEKLSDKTSLLTQGYINYSRGKGEFMLKTTMDNLDLIQSYDYVGFFDWDTEAHFDSISQYLDQFPKNLLQLSLTPESYHTYPYLIQTHTPETIWRQTPLVEIMAPIMSVSFLLNNLDYFSESISGWGLDILLTNQYIVTYKENPWILNALSMNHTKEITSMSWNFNGVTPGDELNYILNKYNLHIPYDKLGKAYSA